LKKYYPILFIIGSWYSCWVLQSSSPFLLCISSNN